MAINSSFIADDKIVPIEYQECQIKAYRKLFGRHWFPLYCAIKNHLDRFKLPSNYDDISEMFDYAFDKAAEKHFYSCKTEAEWTAILRSIAYNGVREAKSREKSLLKLISELRYQEEILGHSGYQDHSSIVEVHGVSAGKG
jgi:hypothetical protein